MVDSVKVRASLVTVLKLHASSRAAKLPAMSLEAASGQLLLGRVLLRQGDAHAAEDACRLCLASREEWLGLQHPDTALALLGAPPQYASTGQPPDALRLYHPAVMLHARSALTW